MKLPTLLLLAMSASDRAFNYRLRFTLGSSGFSLTVPANAPGAKSSQLSL